MDDEQLTPEERDLVIQLRAMPPEGAEPDWAQLEGAIRAAVGPTVPRPWWKRWQWVVPVTALATTVAVAVLWLRHPEPGAPPPRQAQAPAQAAAPASAVWIDDQAVDVGDLDADAVLDAIDPEVHDEVADDVTGGILPAANLDWVDALDDGALDRAERWLDRKKS